MKVATDETTASNPVQLGMVEILQLNTELIEIQREKDLSFSTKYDLVKLYNKTKTIVDNYNEAREGLIKKYGRELEDGSWTLEGSKDEKKGFGELKELNSKKEWFTDSFPIHIFSNLSTTIPYIHIMRFIF